MCSHFPVSWLLRMVRLVFAGIKSVMCLSSCSCRLSLDILSAASATMVWVCLAISKKVVSSFSALLRWLQTSLLVWWLGVAEWKRAPDGHSWCITYSITLRLISLNALREEPPFPFHLFVSPMLSAWHHFLCRLSVLRSVDQFRKLSALLLWPHLAMSRITSQMHPGLLSSALKRAAINAR